MPKEELIAFEEEIKDLFLSAKIKAPIHLSRGNEDELIEIFKNIKPEDWCFSNHRSHYHALLKGLSKEWLKDEILAGRSMHINSKEHKFMTSSIVGGCLPIAVGVAMAIVKQKSDDVVWVFVGDMAAETGTFHECSKYAGRNLLPIVFVVEDNGLSTNTPTYETWGDATYTSGALVEPQIKDYKYKRAFPHINCGSHVVFK